MYFERVASAAQVGFAFGMARSIARRAGLDSSSPCACVHVAYSATITVNMDVLRRTLKRYSRFPDPAGSAERGVPTDHGIQASPIARPTSIRWERSSVTDPPFESRLAKPPTLGAPAPTRISSRTLAQRIPPGRHRAGNGCRLTPMTTQPVIAWSTGDEWL